jgi:putative transposase
LKNQAPVADGLVNLQGSIVRYFRNLHADNMHIALLASRQMRKTILFSEALFPLMETFRQMVNDCVRIGLENNVSTMKKLSILAYHQLSKYNITSYYKLGAIPHAAGILTNRKKSIQRGRVPRNPYARRPFLISSYGFKLVDGVLKVPLGSRQYFDIVLNNHTKSILSDSTLQIRSFTLTSDSLSICYSKEVQPIEVRTLVGIDRNLRNLTVGNLENVVQYDLSKAVDIAENTKSIMKSFKRNDVRIRRKLYSKYGTRRKNRIAQLLHHVSKAVVQKAGQEKSAIVFEDIRRIRQLYQRGNYQGRTYRGRMNSWSFAEIKRLITYKAAWEGIPVIQLTKSETRGTSQLCPRCGKKITQVDGRMLWCDQCKKWMDRDVVAAMNLSVKGRSRFERSQGLAGEAMKGNLERDPIILRVDASKLAFRRKLKS